MESTKWVKNLETGLSWEVSEKAATELLSQRDENGKPLYEETKPPKPDKAPVP
jgi:hypothetical protein